MDTVQNPFQANPSRKKLMSVIAVYIGILTSIIMSTSNSTTLPVAAKEIGGMDIYSMAMTLAGVVGIALMPIYGYFGARHPEIKRPLFTISLVLASVSIFARSIAPNMWWVVISSILLGMYSPSFYVLGYSMIRDMYDQKQAGIYLGIVGTMQSIGLMVGPTLAGIIIQVSGWRAINYVIFPLFLLSAILMFFGCKVTAEEAKPVALAGGKFDAPGATSVILFLSTLILALSLGKYAPFGGTLSNILFALSAVGLIALIIIIRQKGTEAFLPAPMLKDRNVLSLTAVNFFTTFSAMAFTIFLPLYIMMVMKQTPATAGLAMSICAIAGLFMGPIYGRMIAKAGNARNVIMWASGALRFAVHVVTFLFLTPTTPTWIIFVLMFISGFYGTAGGVAPAVAPQIQLKPEVRQLGNSIIQLGQNFGGSTSIAVYTAIITTMGPGKGFPVCVIIAGVSAAIVFFASIPLKKLETVSTSPVAATTTSV
jgi:MFS family permease